MSVLSKIMGLFGYVRRDLLDNEVAKNTALEKQKADLHSEVENLTAHNANLTFKNTLIAQLLGDRGHSEPLQRFREQFGKFYSFMNNDDSLSNEAEAFSLMQSIEKELEVISTAPQLYSKEVIAVGGGFSAGKSEFISSLITAQNVSLTIGIKPTTAIPTYVLSSEVTQLVAFSNSGARVELNKLDSEILSKINHEFIENFGFNLKKIMPFMVLKTPLCYENLCFIDTPGYDPPKSGFKDSDRESANAFLSNANVLLWLIDINEGTIKKDDIDFLSELDLHHKKLYFVLNKADYQNPSQRKGILNEVSKQLNAYNIDYEGIGLYGNDIDDKIENGKKRKKKEYEFEKISLMEFLDSLSSSQTLQKTLIERLFSVYAMYNESILRKKKRKATIYKALHELDIALGGELDEDSPHFGRLSKIKNIFQVGNEAEQSLNELQKIILDMKKSIDEIFGKPLKINLPQIDEKDIKIEFDLAVEEIIDDESTQTKPRTKKKQETKSDEGNEKDKVNVMSKPFPNLGWLSSLFRGV